MNFWSAVKFRKTLSGIRLICRLHQCLPVSGYNFTTLLDLDYAQCSRLWKSAILESCTDCLKKLKINVFFTFFFRMTKWLPRGCLLLHYYWNFRALCYASFLLKISQDIVPKFRLQSHLSKLKCVGSGVRSFYCKKFLYSL